MAKTIKIDQQIIRNRVERISTTANEAQGGAGFEAFWPTFRELLEFVRDLRLTGKKFDAKIDRLIAAGNALIDGGLDTISPEFGQLVRGVWRYVRIAVQVAILVNPDPGLDFLLESCLVFMDSITR